MESALRAWESFYVIIGSAGAALTGLQFVSIAIVADVRLNSSGAEIDTFVTPTIVHFCMSLLVASIMSAPWRTLAGVGATVAACGLFGVVYTMIVMRRARREMAYRPVLEDWIWHAGLPFAGYGSLLGSGIALSGTHLDALFVIAGALLLLLFIGIHNAWDGVTYLIVYRKGTAANEATSEPSLPKPPAAPAAPRPAPPKPPPPNRSKRRR